MTAAQYYQATALASLKRTGKSVMGWLHPKDSLIWPRHRNIYDYKVAFYDNLDLEKYPKATQRIVLLTDIEEIGFKGEDILVPNLRAYKLVHEGKAVTAN
eukprot:NODE_7027_length_818_cov_50.061871_g6424_i0.p1 GENE.NODE_7027_length_818_cov_50.061871_g6424_i0~~NODE_7027_length_818_cov_50.061871_g6424_i0.p1  ORF type:complete len:100 (+),score=17.11 NODE_7027_length_818_cov_50.061871_g6424_i0:61-360(+)